VLARATGLGAIEGGELVLVPGNREAPVLASIQDLARSGVSGLVLEMGGDEIVGGGESFPIIRLPAGYEARKVLGDVDHYVARRRRELFGLYRVLHERLTARALGGAKLDDLLAIAADLLGRPAALDLVGRIVPAAEETAVGDALAAARRAAAGVTEQGVPVACIEGFRVTPVKVESSMRGTLLLPVDPRGSVDEDEAYLLELAAACSVALARSPAPAIPALADVLTGGPRIEDRGGVTRPVRIVAALRDSHLPDELLERTLAAECAARGLIYHAASHPDALVLFAGSGVDAEWRDAFAAVAKRSGAGGLRAGLSRQCEPESDPEAAVSEALAALARAHPGSTVCYDSIELAALLSAQPAWQVFARARLGRLQSRGEEGRELIRTLQAYLQAGRNAVHAARRMHVHRNTMAYRLARIEDLLQVDLSDPDVLLELDLATRVLSATGRSD